MNNQRFTSKRNYREITFRVDNIVLLALMFGLFALNRTSAVANREYAWLVIIAVTLFRSFVHIFKNRKVYFGVYFVIQGAFLMIAFLSRYWAVSPSLSIAGFNSLVLTTVIVFSVINIVDNEKNIKSLIWALAWAGPLMMGYFFVKYGFSNIVNIRIAQQLEVITDINANDLGIKYVISALSFYVYGRLELKKRKKYLIYAVVMTVLSIFTGSRKVILMIGFCFSLMYLFKQKRNQVFRIIVVLVGFFTAIYLMINVPVLYDVIGHRLEETLTLLNIDNLNPYSSTGSRFNMIRLGLELFSKRPFLGYGLANAAIYNGGTYLHNNYVELLVGVGLIGTIVYYTNLLIGLKRNIRIYKTDTDVTSLFFLLIILCLLLMDFALVSYNTRVFQIIIAVAIRYSYLVKRRIIKLPAMKKK